MDEKTFKNLIPAYLEGDLQETENKEFTDYLQAHPQMQAEIDAYKKSWDLLGEIKAIEPDPHYVSNFWSRVASQKSWYKAIPARLKEALSSPRLTPALATVCIIVLVGVFALKNFQGNELMVSIDESELEMVADMELAENFDLIEDIEFYEDLDVIEYYDPQQSRKSTWIKETSLYT